MQTREGACVLGGYEPERAMGISDSAFARQGNVQRLFQVNGPQTRHNESNCGQFRWECWLTSMGQWAYR